jgi:hypothetical protein
VDDIIIGKYTCLFTPMINIIKKKITRERKTERMSVFPGKKVYTKTCDFSSVLRTKFAIISLCKHEACGNIVDERIFRNASARISFELLFEKTSLFQSTFPHFSVFDLAEKQLVSQKLLVPAKTVV